MSSKHCLLAIFVAVSFGCSGSPQSDAVAVFADVETTPVPSSDDAADDPAIWVNSRDPKLSLVLGTDKRRGLQVLNLDGTQREFLEIGAVNNVDLRQSPYAPDSSIVVTSRRNPSGLVILSLDHATRQLSLVASHDLDLATPYGICAGVIDATAYAFINDKDGTYRQYAIDHSFEIHLVRDWRVDTQPEGCVVDDLRETIYIGEEENGIWMASANASAEAELKSFATIERDALVPDIEGLALYHRESQTLLVASSQGSNSYAVFDTDPIALVGSFRIATSDSIDGTSDTDGIAVTSEKVGGFDLGLFVAQDGENSLPDANQNFKLVSWHKISRALGFD